MRENVFYMHVNVRSFQNACVSRGMCETWKVCLHRRFKISKSSLLDDKYNFSPSLSFFLFVLKNRLADTSSSVILVLLFSLSVTLSSDKRSQIYVNPIEQ